MKDIPMFDTETGVSTLVLREIPYRRCAYVRVHSVQPGGLQEHLRECISFCRMCGAELVYATGCDGLETYPVYCSVLTMSAELEDREHAATLVPVTEETVSHWRRLCNEKMASVDNAATLEARQEKEILSSGGAYFIHDAGKLLGIGWLRGSKVLAVAAVEKGSGERVLRTLLTAADADRATLDVASTNLRAIRLYERMGFLTVGEKSRWHQIF